MTDPSPSIDKRVDGLRSEVRQGFQRVDAGVRDLRSEMHQGHQRVDADIRELRIDIGSFQRLMIGFFATTLGSIIAGVVVIVVSHS